MPDGPPGRREEAPSPNAGFGAMPPFLAHSAPFPPSPSRKSREKSERSLGTLIPKGVKRGGSRGPPTDPVNPVSPADLGGPHMPDLGIPQPEKPGGNNYPPRGKEGESRRVPDLGGLTCPTSIGQQLGLPVFHDDATRRKGSRGPPTSFQARSRGSQRCFLQPPTCLHGGGRGGGGAGAFGTG
jgi:hypothetical protein